MSAFFKSHWPTNFGLAAINVYAFVGTAHDGAVIAVGFVLGFIFTFDALRRGP